MAPLIGERMLQIWHAYAGRLHEHMVNFALSFTSMIGINRSIALSIVLGCVCLYVFVKRRRSESTTVRFPDRTRSLEELYGGEEALRRLNNYKMATKVAVRLDRSETFLEALLKEEHLDLKKLQRTVSNLQKGGREDRAVKILENAKKRQADAGNPRQAYEIEMSLVEMLIYQGDFEKALNCDCLKHGEIKDDARRPLYRAVIYGMLDKWKTAKDCWEEFAAMRRQFYKTLEGAFPSLHSITDFDKLKEEVEVRRSEIMNKTNISHMKM